MISLCETCHVETIAAAHKSGCGENIPRANKRSQDSVVVQVGDSEAISTLMEAKELYSVLWNALSSTAQIFPQIDIAAAEKLGSLAKLKASQAMSTLVQLFLDAGLDAQLGCNISTAEISLTVQIKKEMPARPFGEKSWLLWAMLGLLPCQRQLEEIHASSDNYQDHLLANECLAKFGRETGVGVRDKKILCRTSSFRLALCTYRAVSHTARSNGGKQAMFVFGPNYWLLSGYDDQERAFSEDKVAAGRSNLVDAVIADFWRQVEAFPYALTSTFSSQVTTRLRHYIASGVQGEAAAFCPASGHLALYLHGTAGTGKTTFVSAFAASLQASLRARVEPRREVKVVKVPLNSTTPGQLKSILSVQTVCKGHTVVLHLEEVPEQAGQQEALYTMVKSMLGTIVRRYPALAANVIYLLTSNYPACPSISVESEVIRVATPCHAQQAAWARRTIHRLVAAHTRLDTLALHLDCAPPAAGDMRPLNWWCASLGFCIARHAAAAAAACSPLERLTALTVTVSPAAAPATGGDGSAWPELVVWVVRETRWIVSSAGGALDPAAGAAGGEEEEGVREGHAAAAAAGNKTGAGTGSAGSGGGGKASRFMKTRVGPLGLTSHDGFFYYHMSPPSAPAAPLAAGMEGQNAEGWRAVSARVQAVVDMCVGKWLKPAVLVLSGASHGKGPLLDDLRCRLRGACGGGRVYEETVDLRCAGDEDKVYGRSRDIRGGIFKAMDDVNNPNLPAGREEAASLLLVECRVNEAGQVMLRELLETNDLSRTHRQAVHKERVMFVVNVDEAAPLHDTIRSRAHLLLHSPSAPPPD